MSSSILNHVFTALVLLIVQVPSSIAILNVNIVDASKNAVRQNCSVIIERGVFTQVGLSAKTKVPSNAKKVDGTGKFLIPGLWDMHVHWYDEKALGLFTANGVVGVRSMFGMPDHIKWRAKIDRGEMAGPHIYAGSPIVDGMEPVWPMSIAVKEPKQAHDVVAKIKSDGYDFVKVYSLLSKESYNAIAKEANKQDIAFEGHVPYAVSLLEAARAGQKTNEHLGGFVIDLSSREKELHAKLDAAMKAAKAMQEVPKILAVPPGTQRQPFDPAKVEKLANDLSKTKMWQCPTLVVLYSICHLDIPAFTNDPRLKYMSKEMRDAWKPENDFRLKNKTAKDWEADRMLFEMRKSLVKPLLKAGNRFLAGTDCLNPFCFPGFSLHDELAMLVEAGLTPAQALEAATVNPARFMGKETKFGRIEKGMRADCVLLSKNPLLDVRNTKSILAVNQGKQYFDRKAIDAILKANEHE